MQVSMLFTPFLPLPLRCSIDTCVEQANAETRWLAGGRKPPSLAVVSSFGSAPSIENVRLRSDARRSSRLSIPRGSTPRSAYTALGSALAFEPRFRSGDEPRRNTIYWIVGGCLFDVLAFGSRPGSVAIGIPNIDSLERLFVGPPSSLAFRQYERHVIVSVESQEIIGRLDVPLALNVRDKVRERLAAEAILSHFARNLVSHRVLTRVMHGTPERYA